MLMKSVMQVVSMRLNRLECSRKIGRIPVNEWYIKITPIGLIDKVYKLLSHHHYAEVTIFDLESQSIKVFDTLSANEFNFMAKNLLGQKSSFSLCVRALEDKKSYVMYAFIFKYNVSKELFLILPTEIELKEKVLSHDVQVLSSQAGLERIMYKYQLLMTLEEMFRSTVYAGNEKFKSARYFSEWLSNRFSKSTGCCLMINDGNSGEKLQILESNSYESCNQIHRSLMYYQETKRKVMISLVTIPLCLSNYIAIYPVIMDGEAIRYSNNEETTLLRDGSTIIGSKLNVFALFSYLYDEFLKMRS